MTDPTIACPQRRRLRDECAGWGSTALVRTWPPRERGSKSACAPSPLEFSIGVYAPVSKPPPSRRTLRCGREVPPPRIGRILYLGSRVKPDYLFRGRETSASL